MSMFRSRDLRIMSPTLSLLSQHAFVKICRVHFQRRLEKTAKVSHLPWSIVWVGLIYTLYHNRCSAFHLGISAICLTRASVCASKVLSRYRGSTCLEAGNQGTKMFTNMSTTILEILLLMKLGSTALWPAGRRQENVPPSGVKTQGLCNVEATMYRYVYRSEHRIVGVGI